MREIAYPEMLLWLVYREKAHAKPKAVLSNWKKKLNTRHITYPRHRFEVTIMDTQTKKNIQCSLTSSHALVSLAEGLSSAL